MKSVWGFCVIFLAAAAALAIHPSPALAARVTVDLGDAQGVTLAGAVWRWDRDGNLRRPADQAAKIDAPPVDHKAADTGRGRWVFKDLPAGTYDLVILTADRRRIEGFTYVPVLEFDPFFTRDATIDQRTRQQITDDIARSRHFENRVAPLYMAGDAKSVRVLVMLIRDQPTSLAPGVGTIRHEVWQYTWQYGGWQKEKRTKVLDRILMPVDELRRWTWLWDPELGGIEVKDQPLVIDYRLPRRDVPADLRGLRPY